LIVGISSTVGSNLDAQTMLQCHISRTSLLQ
jgi:hypothetical protein